MNTQLVFTIFIATAVLLLFLYLYCPVIFATLKNKGVQPASNYVYVATALAGLIGSVCAMFFEQNYQEISRQSLTAHAAAQKNAPATPATANDPQSSTGSAIEALGKSLNPVAHQMMVISSTDAKPTAAEKISVQLDWVSIVKTLYVICYLLAGFAALVAWIKADNPPPLVSNLALITLGLVMAIAKSIFALPSQGLPVP